MTRLFGFGLLLGAVLIGVGGCKPVLRSGDASSVRGGPDAVDPIIKWEIDWQGKKETVIIGYSLPGGDIRYFDTGVKQLTAVVANVFANGTIDENMIERVIREASPDSKVDSSQMARNILPEQLIPPALWNKGIRFDMFIWPMERFKPDEVVRSYEALRTAAFRESNKLLERVPLNARALNEGFTRQMAWTSVTATVRKVNPLLGSDPITFKRLMPIYRKVYDLPVFEFIRNQVAKDEIYQQAASAMMSAIESEASAIFLPAVSALWEGLIPSPAKGAAIGVARRIVRSSAKTVGLMLTTLLPRRYVANAIDDAMNGDEGRMRSLQNLRALRQDGLKGIEYLEANRTAINYLMDKAGASRAPAFAAFLGEHSVRAVLMDPIGCYELKALQERVEKIDLDLLRRLNDLQTMAVHGISDQFVGRDGDEVTRTTMRKVFTIGARSRLFNELAAMVLATGDVPKLTLQVQSDASILGVHSTGEIKLVAISKTKDLSPGDERELAYTLAHEFWHAASKHWLFNQLFYFSSGKEFLTAVASDEMVAMALSLRVRSEVLGTMWSPRTMDALVDYLDPSNFSWQPFRDLVMPRGQILSSDLYQVAHQNYADAVKAWRDIDSVAPKWNVNP